MTKQAKPILHARDHAPGGADVLGGGFIAYDFLNVGAWLSVETTSFGPSGYGLHFKQAFSVLFDLAASQGFEIKDSDSNDLFFVSEAGDSFFYLPSGHNFNIQDFSSNSRLSVADTGTTQFNLDTGQEWSVDGPGGHLLDIIDGGNWTANVAGDLDLDVAGLIDMTSIGTTTIQAAGLDLLSSDVMTIDATKVINIQSDTDTISLNTVDNTNGFITVTPAVDFQVSATRDINLSVARYFIVNGLPTSASGLPSGALWLNSNVVTRVP